VVKGSGQNHSQTHFKNRNVYESSDLKKIVNHSHMSNYPSDIPKEALGKVSNSRGLS
jgi:hypothetical protein